MKRITTILMTLLLSNLLVGQVSISRQVIGSTGGTAVGSSVMVTSTVGEANTQTLFSVSNILTQGFQQTLKLDSIDGAIKLYNKNNTKSAFVGLDSDEPCELKFYTGITPNGDGINDIWIIDNIEQFPVNYIQIFNRWGQQVWDGNVYDNTEVVWKGNNSSGDEMADGTYFYVALVRGKTYKGWVELTR